MASEDIYAGISAGANYLVGVIESKRKADLERELFDKRMAMQEKIEENRAARAEAREAKKVAGDKVVQDSSGNFVRRSVNSFGDTIKEEPVTQLELDQINNTKRKDELSLESLAARAQADKFKVTNLEADRAMDLEDRQLDRRAKNASIESSLASAAAARARAAKEKEDDSPPTETQAANSLIKGNEDFVNSLTQPTLDEDGKKTGDPVMTRAQIDLYARAAIANAAKARKDGVKASPDDLFVQGLRNAVYQKKGAKPAAKTSGRGFSLDGD
ncbi:hypothetical protein [Xanthomonas phage DES1]|nr:hypothetical protein [Xanthomonas phage DES1]